jgi:hypothetical protein
MVDINFNIYFTHMKNYLVLSCLVLLFTACSKKNDNEPGAANYHDANGTFINFSSARWYVSKDGSFVTLYVKITGNTNSDTMTIRTIGDGLQTDVAIELLPDHTFSMDVPIVFTADGGSPGSFDISTGVIAFKGNDKLVATLKSGKVNY